MSEPADLIPLSELPREGCFLERLLQRIADAQFSHLPDNIDEHRFGSQAAPGLLKRVSMAMRRWLARRGVLLRRYLHTPNARAASWWLPIMTELDWLDRRLDEPSRDLLVDLVAYRLLGPSAIRLPLGTQSYRNERRALEALSDPNDSLDPGFKQRRLRRHDLSSLGFPIALYLRNPMTLFVVEQYRHIEAAVGVQPGDVVIDGGGCYGDTALYFAHLCGERGCVHSFEFVHSNLAVLNSNLRLNNDLASRVRVVECALWCSTGETLYVQDRGPASRVGPEPFGDDDQRTATQRIDDYVEEAGLSSVDFIKMDIEGAEEMALRGAEQTIRRYQPKLAICLYHSARDFARIPRLLHAWCPAYRFRLKHATMHAEETVLFASIEK